jgi:hypothetical protein
LWIASFFVCLWHSDNTTYLVTLWNGVLSLHSGRCLPCNGCLRWYEEYTDYGNTSYLLAGIYDYHYIWKLPTILKRWLLPNTHTQWSLRIIDLPIWPLFAPIVAWTIVLWCRSQPRGAGPRCSSCGYNLTANVSGICPECGKPIPQAEPDKCR